MTTMPYAQWVKAKRCDRKARYRDRKAACAAKITTAERHGEDATLWRAYWCPYSASGTWHWHIGHVGTQRLKRRSAS